ncbi:MAG: alpha/beta hydrolase family protein [Promethearchaeota archaeon]
MIFFKDRVEMYLYSRKFKGKGEQNLKKLSRLYETKSEWLSRAELIRNGILNGALLNPLPRKSPINPVYHGKREYSGYMVENVHFESVPGFHVCGNIYRPNWAVENKRRCPVILKPHGHFPEGRFRRDNQLLCSMLAKMGAIVFTYDMVGYGDSVQLEHKVPHALTFQLWNSIRSLDFLFEHEKIDKNFVGVTGASGGGTQAFLLTAVDDRVTASAPAIMVSSSFFGGCICESGLPIHRGIGYKTNNAEISAMAAPRPQLLISIGTDWTRMVPIREYPFIKRIYSFFNAADKIQNVHLLREKHDLGQSKRNAIYKFFSRHFKLDLSPYITSDGKIDESGCVIEEKDVMRAFNDQYPLPEDSLQGDDAVFKAIDSSKEKGGVGS